MYGGRRQIKMSLTTNSCCLFGTIIEESNNISALNNKLIWNKLI